MRDISYLPKEEQAAILARREYYRKWRKANADTATKTSVIH
ncbi:hypothetical protein [Ruminococcus flavefaciens]|nr:hypothetical protein [Ruminococcus flavefaciens]